MNETFDPAPAASMLADAWLGTVSEPFNLTAPAAEIAARVLDTELKFRMQPGQGNQTRA